MSTDSNDNNSTKRNVNQLTAITNCTDLLHQTATGTTFFV